MACDPNLTHVRASSVENTARCSSSSPHRSGR
jgi:hypothetical protein